MSILYSTLATHMVEALDVQTGEIILVRDHCGLPALVEEALLAIDLAGATPLAQIEHPAYLERLLAGARPETLRVWHRHRQDWARQADRVLVLTGGYLDFSALPAEQGGAWQDAYRHLDEIEEERRLPMLIAALPTPSQAAQIGMAVEELERALLPALMVSAAELDQRIRPVLAAVQSGQEIVIRSGEDCELHLLHGERPWLVDAGRITPQGREQGAVVANLPAGAIYTTAVETATHGQLWLPRAGEAKNVRLTFAGGRISRIEAETGGEQFGAMLDSNTGEPRRVSHVGLGLNPALHHPVGWAIVDEHIDGNLFICLGENRYMGGENASSLNVDYTIPGGILLVDGLAIQ